MLKEILSISGKPGLYKLISQGKNMFITESLIDQKRIPVYAKDKAVSLGDIAIYTEDEEVPLIDIFRTIQEKANGEKLDLSQTTQPDQLRNYFAEILPEFDRERVYPSDIKKIMNWYNLLINAGITEFAAKEEETEVKKEEKETKE